MSIMYIFVANEWNDHASAYKLHSSTHALKDKVMAENVKATKPKALLQGMAHNWFMQDMCEGRIHNCS